MSDHPEIIRARENIASADALLERCRNRPRHESSWLDDRERNVTVPVHKVTEDAAVSRIMDPETQAKWDAWARGIAQRAADERMMDLSRVIIDVIKPKFAKLQKTIEAQAKTIKAQAKRIADLEKRADPKVAQLRTGTNR